jgi:hypothetical protein
MSHFCILLDNKLLQTPCVFILTSSFFCQSLMKNQYATRWYLFVGHPLTTWLFQRTNCFPSVCGAFSSGRVVQTLFADINIEANFPHTCFKTTTFLITISLAFMHSNSIFIC